MGHDQGDKKGKVRRLAIYGVALVAAVSMTAASLNGLVTAQGAAQPVAVHPHATGTAPNITVSPSAAELAQWRAETATPAQRAATVEKMQAAFAGLARVGVGPLPIKSDDSVSSAAPVPVAQAASTGATPPMREALSYGITGSHFWLIASYGDIARGAITTAVRVCEEVYDIPALICGTAGKLLTTLSHGMGSANNHGVWVAVYWWPPHVTGGRW